MKRPALVTGFQPFALSLAVLCTVVCAAPSLAHAQATAQERALSESLFVEGKKLLDEGDAEKACPKLAESQRLDPGGGTQLLLGLCWEQVGRFATAWLEFKEALALALRDGRESRIQIAREHIAALEPRLSRIEFHVSEEAAVAGLKIAREGAVIPRAAWSVAMPFDEGQHEFEISAPGYKTAMVTAQVSGEGQLVDLEVPVLEKAPEAAPEAEESATTAPVAMEKTASEPETDRGPSVQPIVGWALIGGAALAGGIGGYFGLRAISLSSETKDKCPESTCEFPELQGDYDKAGTAAINSNIAFIAAGALATAGVVTLLTAKPRQKVSTAEKRTRFSIAPTSAGAQLHVMGAF